MSGIKTYDTIIDILCTDMNNDERGRGWRRGELVPLYTHKHTHTHIYIRLYVPPNSSPPPLSSLTTSVLATA